MTTQTFTRDIPIGEPYDLVVCGGGPSGIPTALSARRAGLRVLLVEQTGQLGGVGTSAGVSHLLGGRTRENTAYKNVDTDRLREDLKNAGAVVDWQTEEPAS